MGHLGLVFARHSADTDDRPLESSLFLPSCVELGLERLELMLLELEQLELVLLELTSSRVELVLLGLGQLELVLLGLGRLELVSAPVCRHEPLA